MFKIGVNKCFLLLSALPHHSDIARDQEIIHLPQQPGPLQHQQSLVILLLAATVEGKL